MIRRPSSPHCKSVPFHVCTLHASLYFTSTNHANGNDVGIGCRRLGEQRELDARYYSCIQSAVTAGVKVALGSDFIGWNPAITAREFRLMVELGGMTPLQAILAGTSSAAALLEMDDVGQIQVGMRADLVIVSGDPIEDISLLETGVLAVVKNGKLVRNSFC